MSNLMTVDIVQKTIDSITTTLGQEIQVVSVFVEATPQLQFHPSVLEALEDVRNGRIVDTAFLDRGEGA